MNSGCLTVVIISTSRHAYRACMHIRFDTLHSYGDCMEMHFCARCLIFSTLTLRAPCQQTIKPALYQRYTVNAPHIRDAHTYTLYTPCICPVQPVYFPVHTSFTQCGVLGGMLAKPRIPIGVMLAKPRIPTMRCDIPRCVYSCGICRHSRCIMPYPAVCTAVASTGTLDAS